MMLPPLARSYTSANLLSPGQEDGGKGCMLFSKKYSHMYGRPRGSAGRSRDIPWAGEEGEAEKQRKKKVSTESSSRDINRLSQPPEPTHTKKHKVTSSPATQKSSKSPGWKRHSTGGAAASQPLTSNTSLPPHQQYRGVEGAPFNSIHTMHTEAVLIQKRRPGYKSKSTSELHYLTTQMLSDHRRSMEAQSRRDLVSSASTTRPGTCRSAIHDNVYLDQAKLRSILTWVDQVERARASNSLASVFSS